MKKYNPDSIFQPPGSWVNAVQLEPSERLLVSARCAMTGIIVQLVDPSMVIEIDVYAAK